MTVSISMQPKSNASNSSDASYTSRGFESLVPAAIMPAQDSNNFLALRGQHVVRRLIACGGLCFAGIAAVAGFLSGTIHWAMEEHKIDIDLHDFVLNVEPYIALGCLPAMEFCQEKLIGAGKSLASAVKSTGLAAGQWLGVAAAALGAHVIAKSVLDNIVSDTWDLMESDPEFAREVGWTGGPLTLGLVNDLPYEVQIENMRMTDGYLWRYPGLTGHSFYPDQEGVFQMNSNVFQCDVGLEMTLRIKDCPGSDSLISFAVRRVKCFNSLWCERIRVKINSGSAAPARNEVCGREGMMKHSTYEVLGKLSDMAKGKVRDKC